MHHTGLAGHASGRVAGPVILLAVCSALTSCRAPAPIPAAPTQIDRLIAAHPELNSGRFSVIADFEDPRHTQLLSWSGASPGSRFTIDATAGRRETGGTAVRLSSSSSRDTLSISNDHATDWYMRRDWRGFDLLLIAVQAPAKSSLRLEISAGSGEDRRNVQTLVPLDRGWNQVRLDLADLAERVPIDDVRELRLGIADDERSADLVIDDLILTASTEELFSDAPEAAHGLYARRVGRRLHIGAAGRFELVFAGGQIVGWYDLSRDPKRLENLVRGTALGPFPVTLGGADDSAGASSNATSAWGSSGTVSARQRLIEANAIRVRVEAELEASDATRGGTRTRTVYTAYADGGVFVDAEWTFGAGAATSGTVVTTGFASALSEGCRFQVEPGSGPCAGAELRCDAATSRLGIWWLSPTLAVPALLPDAGEGAAMVTAPVPVGTDGVARWAAEIRLAGTVVDAEGGEPPAEGSPLASATPGSVSQFKSGEANCLTRGVTMAKGLPFAASGLADPASGFNPADGCFHIEPADGTARLVIDQRNRRPVRLAFAAHLPPDHHAWVYVDGVLLAQTVRVTPEQLLFEVRTNPKARTIVEVLTRETRPADDFRRPR